MMKDASATSGISKLVAYGGKKKWKKFNFKSIYICLFVHFILKEEEMSNATREVKFLQLSFLLLF